MTAPGPSPSQSNALSAQALIEVRELLDRQLSPLGLEAIRVLSPHPGEFILDIGCGTGETVIQLADAVGPSGRVVGVDISLLVLEEARGARQDGKMSASFSAMRVRWS